MNRLGAMLKTVIGHAGNLLLAIVLAVLVWLVAERQINPLEERTFPNRIPATLQNVPLGMITYDEGPRSASITLSAPKSVWDNLTPDRVAAYVDLGGQQPGTLELPIHVKVDDRSIQVVKVNPANVRLKLEPLVETPLPISVNVAGDPALGFAQRPLVSNPATATVRGPASYVRQVAVVAGQLSIQDARSTVTQTINLAARSREGQSVPYVTVIPSNTQIVIPLQPLGGFRDLSVKIDLRDTVAPGYLMTNVSVEPQVVTVFGSSAALQAVPGYIATEPISVTEATEDIDRRARLLLPPGVSYLGEPTVQVKVTIRAVESSATVLTPVLPQGLTPELSVAFSPETIDVLLRGPLTSLSTLQSEDVQTFVNLFGLEVGTYAITPTVVVPSGINVVSVLPSTVQATISEIITPTATVTATATVTGTLTSPLPTPTPRK
jgi:YbbR domain-containing protein